MCFIQKSRILFEQTVSPVGTPGILKFKSGEKIKHPNNRAGQKILESSTVLPHFVYDCPNHDLVALQ